MRGKRLITIRTTVSTNSFSIGMFSFILDGKGSDCSIERILQYYTCIYTDFIRLRKFFKKNTSSCNTCVIRTECSTYHRFRLKKFCTVLSGLNAAQNSNSRFTVCNCITPLVVLLTASVMADAQIQYHFINITVFVSRNVVLTSFQAMFSCPCL